MEGAGFAAVSGEGGGASAVNAVYPILQLDLQHKIKNQMSVEWMIKY
jgi:hypothetical protein